MVDSVCSGLRQKARAGCPIPNVQQTLNGLTSAGFAVNVYEEHPHELMGGTKLKKRFLFFSTGSDMPGPCLENSLICSQLREFVGSGAEMCAAFGFQTAAAEAARLRAEEEARLATAAARQKLALVAAGGLVLGATTAVLVRSARQHPILDVALDAARRPLHHLWAAAARSRAGRAALVAARRGLNCVSRGAAALGRGLGGVLLQAHSVGALDSDVRVAPPTRLLEEASRRAAPCESSILDGLTLVVGGAAAVGGADAVKVSFRAKLVQKGLTDHHFDLVVGHLGATLVELGVPAAEVGEAAAVAESVRDAVLGRAA